MLTNLGVLVLLQIMQIMSFHHLQSFCSNFADQ